MRAPADPEGSLRLVETIERDLTLPMAVIYARRIGGIHGPYHDYESKALNKKWTVRQPLFVFCCRFQFLWLEEYNRNKNTLFFSLFGFNLEHDRARLQECGVGRESPISLQRLLADQPSETARLHDATDHLDRTSTTIDSTTSTRTTTDD